MTASILVVDDDLDVRDTLALLLEDEGYHCEKAINGADALEKMKQTSYDIIITDLNMPVMSGLDLLRHIKSNQIPIAVIVAITGFPELIAEVESIGVDGLITKPFDADGVFATIKKALGSDGN